MFTIFRRIEDVMVFIVRLVLLAFTIFALIGMAGELATEYGVTGWQPGAAIQAAAEGFRLWQSARGQGNDERRQIMERVSAFIERHGDGRRGVDPRVHRHGAADAGA